MLLRRIVLFRPLNYFNLNTSIRNLNQSRKTIRNIGILAHIDAGKTTTTERMLFYSGKTHVLGEVHHGNTVTDCLAQERERGITICSSAVSFDWKDCRINLLDTPGHIDFTMEVEQSLGAVDGVCIILDASAGVEAQTITVWSQADHHELPRIAFANKMDRIDADFEGTIKDLKQKLNAVPAVLQWPLKENGKLMGIIDIVRKQLLTFENEGRSLRRAPLSSEMEDHIMKKRHSLIDTISGFDDDLADFIITSNSLDEVNEVQLLDAIRRATIQRKIIPVLLGSAYKNTGVQPLMDAVVHQDFVGKVFKVTHDKQKGALSLIRILSGKLRKGSKVVTSRGNNENVQKLYEALADEYREIQEITEGDIAVGSGLKSTHTGDLLLSNTTALKYAQKKLLKRLKKEPLPMSDSTESLDEISDFETISSALGLVPKIPDAVYFCSIEPPSLSYQVPLENALKQLQREDPSLRVNFDETTMQTVLGGMGELHLEIVKSRLRSEFKIDADLGPLQIAYKETIVEEARDSILIEKEIAGAKQSVLMEISLVRDRNETFAVDTSPEATQNLQLIRLRTLNVFKKGAVAALSRGPILGGNTLNTQIILHNLKIGRGTADSFLMSSAAQCVQKVFLKGGCRLLEPIMSIEIVSPSDRTSKILSDLAKRRATILNVGSKGDSNKVISVLAPLAELSGYSSVIRTISSGAATMSMQPHGYTEMTPFEEAAALRRAQGLE
ncbi:Ribosome-releasing factor 2, mitochondrial [Pseudolycoriella hygida]|uniref:Ribosome-releasing factor 2, mitochondrial n=1 Tax=Pseudolycoriella hygida TaxID=35572 RepID=A0A9Q0MV13_9DIPT|nr:Ribosome-releasing factor 2, mitochondrial [Pseudolycoriella hygida]